MPRPATMPADQRTRVLSAADVSRRTLRRYLAGEPLLASTMRRLDAALRAEGLERLIEVRASKRAA